MEAGSEREALVEVADRLCAELGYAGEAEFGETTGAALGDPLDPEDEQLVAAVRQNLARIATAVGAGRAQGVTETAVRALLGGVELVMRRELMMGKPAGLQELLPSFVFLVTLPLVDHDEAQELADRTASLFEEVLG